MFEAERVKFSQGIEVLRDCYPNLRQNETWWAGMLGAYWKALGDLPWPAVFKALEQATRPEYYPDYFPTAGQLRRVADECNRALLAEQRRQDQERRGELGADEAKRDFVMRVPVTLEGQKAYVEEAASAGEKLARIWECESRRLGIMPHDVTPPEVVKQRMAELAQMLDGLGELPKRKRRKEAA